MQQETNTRTCSDVKLCEKKPRQLRREPSSSSTRPRGSRNQTSPSSRPSSQEREREKKPRQLRRERSPQEREPSKPNFAVETKLRRRIGRRRKSASARRNQDNFAVSGRRKSVSRRLRVHGREGEETKLRRRVGRRRKSASARRNRKSVCRRLGERRPRARRNQTLPSSRPPCPDIKLFNYTFSII
jgi:hypothetical protein